MDTTVPPSQAAVAGAATEDKTVAIISYITIIGFIAAIFLHQNNKTQLGAFHLRQVLGIVLTGVAGGMIGVVPILGDVFDAAWKANQRNVRLLEQHLDDPAASTRSSRRLVALVTAGLLVVMLLFATLTALIVKAILAAAGG